MKRIKILILSFIMVILIFFATLIFLIIDNSELINNSIDSKVTMEDFRNEKLSEALDSALENSGEMTLHVSEDELNMLVNYYMRDKLAAIKEKYYISDFVINTNKSDLELGIKVKYVGLVPTIIRIKFIPVIKDNTFAVEILSVKIGKLTLAKDKLLELLLKAKSDKFQIDKNENLIIINTDLPDQLIIQSTTVNEEILTIGLKIKISSMDDVLEVTSFLLPDTEASSRNFVPKN